MKKGLYKMKKKDCNWKQRKYSGNGSKRNDKKNAGK